MNESETYGVSPTLTALGVIRAWNSLPQYERVTAATRFIEDRLIEKLAQLKDL